MRSFLNLNRVYPVIVLAVLAGATIWLERLTVETPRHTAKPRTGPDFIAEITHITGFGENGMQRYELFTPLLEHFPESNITRLEQPMLIMTSPEKELTITAKYANVSPDGDRVDLVGDVHAKRISPVSAERGELTFASERLTVWPEDHRAETDAPVVLTQGVTTANALALKADNLFGELDLIGQANVNIPRRTPKSS